MSLTTPTQAHIAYELIDDVHPKVVVIEFLTQDIAGSVQAAELAEQLESLIRPDVPQNFVMNFSNARFSAARPSARLSRSPAKRGGCTFATFPKACGLVRH